VALIDMGVRRTLQGLDTKAEGTCVCNLEYSSVSSVE